MTVSAEQYAKETRKRADVIPKLVASDLADVGTAAIAFTRQFLRSRFKRRPVSISESLKQIVKTSGATGELRVQAGEGVPYTEIQEDGGKAAAKGGGFMIIPKVPFVKTLLRKGGSAALRGIPDTRLQEIRGGDAMLLLREHAGRGKAGHKARSEILAILVGGTTHKGHHFLRDGFAEGIAAQGEGKLGKAGILGAADGVS